MPPRAHLSWTTCVGGRGGLVKIPGLSEIVGMSTPPGAHLSWTWLVGSHVTCHVTLLRLLLATVRGIRWPPVKLLLVISSSPPPPPSPSSTPPV